MNLQKIVKETSFGLQLSGNYRARRGDLATGSSGVSSTKVAEARVVELRVVEPRVEEAPLEPPSREAPRPLGRFLDILNI